MEFPHLPLDIRRFEIVRHLPNPELIKFFRTNRDYYQYYRDPRIWRYLLGRNFIRPDQAESIPNPRSIYFVLNENRSLNSEQINDLLIQNETLQPLVRLVSKFINLTRITFKDNKLTYSFFENKTNDRNIDRDVIVSMARPVKISGFIRIEIKSWKFDIVVAYSPSIRSSILEEWFNQLFEFTSNTNIINYPTRELLNERLGQFAIEFKNLLNLEEAVPPFTEIHFTGPLGRIFVEAYYTMEEVD